MDLVKDVARPLVRGIKASLPNDLPVDLDVSIAAVIDGEPIRISMRGRHPLLTVKVLHDGRTHTYRTHPEMGPERD